MILNSPYISGSLTVTGNTNLMGALTVTGSLAGTATSSSFAYTASSAVSAYTASSAVNATTALTASYANTFTVGGTLTAQTLVVQTITASIEYSSGSNIFGSTLSNTQTLTGSVNITGSIKLNNSKVIIADDAFYTSGIYSAIGFGGVTNGNNRIFAGDGTLAGLFIASATNNAIYFRPAGKASNDMGIFPNGNTALGVNFSLPTATLHISGSGSGSLMQISSTVSSSIFFVSGSGNIGIGTTTPAYRLTITGPTASLHAGLTTNGEIARFSAPNGFSGSILLGRPDVSSEGLTLTYDSTNGNSIQNTIVGSHIIQTANVERMRVTSAGNVGIGTTSPNGRFEVATGSAGVTVGDFLVDTTNKYVYVGRQSSTSGDNTTFVVRDRTGTARATIPGGGSLDTIFTTNASNFNVTNYGGTSLFFVSGSGNVGIGTTSPAYLLDVNGTGRFSGKLNANVALSDTAGTFALAMLGDYAGLRTGTDGSFNVDVYKSGTGYINPFKIAPTGVATFSNNITATYVSSVTSSSSNISLLFLQNTAGWASSQITSISVKDGSDVVGAIGWKYDGVGNVDMLFHSLYNGAYKTTSNIAMTVKGTGNVGIGTTSPLGLLQIGGSDSSGTLYVTASASQNAARLRNNNASYGTLDVANADSSGYGIYATGGKHYFGGNFGIGTTSPSQVLHISNASNYVGALINGSNAPQLCFAQGVGTSPNWKVGISGNDGNAFSISSGSINADKLVILRNGNVGIGTFAPAYTLDVSGTVRCQSPLRISNESTYGITFTAAGGSAGNTILADGSQGLVLGGNGTTALTFSSNSTTATFAGAVSKASGTFKIDHPLESLSETHQLVHSFIEGPRVDLIYRGTVNLVSGSAIINIDQTSGMTEGTFVALNRETQVFTTNETSWDAVKGNIEGNILTITSQNSESTDKISWMVIGERQDKHIKDTDWTDSNGKPILEPLKELENN